MKKIFTLCALLFLAACSNIFDTNEPNNKVENNDPTTNGDEQPNDKDKEKENDNTINFSQYFMESDSFAHFLGDGNEYASYTSKTVWLDTNYVAIAEDNGGAATIRIYRIETDKILKISDDLVEGFVKDIVYPKVSTLENLPAIETYLKGPIEVGTTFDTWTIIEVDQTLETPYQIFDNVFVIEEKGEDYVNRKYFAEGFGEVKRESIMNMGDGEEDYVVTSILEKLEIE